MNLEINLNCNQYFVNDARKFGANSDIRIAAANKAYCKGFSTVDSIDIGSCNENLIVLLDSEISNNCKKKKKCSVKINIFDIIENCPDYSKFEYIYFTYSCYGINY